MPDETQVEMTNTPEAAPDKPQAVTAEQLQAELDKTREALKAVNREAADRRKKLEAYEADETKRREAEMTETQKLAEQAKKAGEIALKAEQDRDAAIARANETLTRSMVLVGAGAMGFADPGDAWQFIDRSKLKLSDAGEVEGVKEALEVLAKAKPYLLKSDAQAAKPKGTPQAMGRTAGNKPTTAPPAVPIVRL